MKQRIIGFDLARAYATFGMFIVNFNIVFGKHDDPSVLGQFLSLFNGNSSTVFVILAGMGMALMTNRSTYTASEKSHLRGIINKRALFLFIFGVLLNMWWPADILHFYGGYMHFAVLLIFVPKRFYLWGAGLAILIFHLLLLVIPYEKGWNFETLQYTDFYTIEGFFRNTFFNGWNPIFPWLAYFLLGMYLGRLNWTTLKTQRTVFFIGLTLFFLISLLQFLAHKLPISDGLKQYLMADYLPPFLPFMLSTSGFGMMLIAFFMFVGQIFGNSKLAQNFAALGQMTLTHYVSHLTIGILILTILTGRNLVIQPNETATISPILILLAAVVYFILSFYFSQFWAKKFKNGPLETVMRWISG